MPNNYYIYIGGQSATWFEVTKNEHDNNTYTAELINEDDSPNILTKHPLKNKKLQELDDYSQLELTTYVLQPGLCLCSKKVKLIDWPFAEEESTLGNNSRLTLKSDQAHNFKHYNPNK